MTGFGSIVGTLEYMSPEQAELNNQDVDTRSDIYSLGRAAVRTVDGHDAVEPNPIGESGPHGNAADDPRSGAAKTQHAIVGVDGFSAVNLGPAADRASQAVAVWFAVRSTGS